MHHCVNVFDEWIARPSSHSKSALGSQRSNSEALPSDSFLVFVAVRCGEAGLTSELVFGSIENRRFSLQAYRDVFTAGPDKQVLTAGPPKVESLHESATAMSLNLQHAWQT